MWLHHQTKENKKTKTQMEEWTIKFRSWQTVWNNRKKDFQKGKKRKKKTERKKEGEIFVLNDMMPQNGGLKETQRGRFTEW